MPDMISSQFRESKLLIGILVVISAIIITFSYFNYKENANHTQFFESEKEFLKQELLILTKSNRGTPWRQFTIYGPMDYTLLSG